MTRCKVLIRFHSNCRNQNGMRSSFVRTRKRGSRGIWSIAESSICFLLISARAAGKIGTSISNVHYSPAIFIIKLPFCERLKVLTVPNVLSIVGTRTCPSVVSDDEISWIKSGVEHGGLKPHSYLEVGTRVVVMSGVAAGMEGILLRKHNNVRILVALDSIAQAFVIEIDGALVKPVGGKLACAASASQIQEHQGGA
jgi:hypothetical protein